MTRVGVIKYLKCRIKASFVYIGYFFKIEMKRLSWKIIIIIFNDREIKNLSGKTCLR